MPHIDSSKFGEIIIDNKKYRQVLIIGNSVSEREYERLVGLFDTSHRIGDWEIMKLLKGSPDVVVIGTGQEGRLDVGEELFKKSKDKNIEVLVAITPEAIKIYNEKVREGRRVNALIHTTC